MHNPNEHKANSVENRTLINSKGLTERVIILRTRRVLITRRLAIGLLLCSVIFCFDRHNLIIVQNSNHATIRGQSRTNNWPLSVNPMRFGCIINLQYANCATDAKHQRAFIT